MNFRERVSRVSNSAAINIIGRIINNNNNNSARHGSTKEGDARLGTRANELKSDG